MNKEQATDFVVRELGKMNEKNNIIQKLCESTNMNWSQAENFVQQIETEYAVKISSKQNPIVGVISGCTTLIGLGVLIFVIFTTWQGNILVFLKIPIPYSGNAFLFLAGLGMLVGGIRGMWGLLTRIWNS